MSFRDFAVQTRLEISRLVRWSLPMGRRSSSGESLSGAATPRCAISCSRPPCLTRLESRFGPQSRYTLLGGSAVGSGFGGALSGGIIHSISAISEKPLRVEERAKKVNDGAGGIIEQKTKFPIWFDPTSSGGTPMRAALTKTLEVVAEWCDAHRASYPPTVLRVTDGQSTDGGPEEVAGGLHQISTDDGSCLLFNLHVTAGDGREIVFPVSDSTLADEYSRMLFRISSPLPGHLAKFAGDKGYSITDGSRGFIFNGDPKCIVDFFEIGTRPKMVTDR
jgi:hypothetical protein